MLFIFSQDGEKDFLSLERSVQNIIRKKLEKIKQGGGYNLKPLINMKPATHRLRIDDIRIILRQCDEGYEIIAIGHRSTIYK